MVVYFECCNKYVIYKTFTYMAYQPLIHSYYCTTALALTKAWHCRFYSAESKHQPISNFFIKADLSCIFFQFSFLPFLYINFSPFYREKLGCTAKAHGYRQLVGDGETRVSFDRTFGLHAEGCIPSSAYLAVRKMRDRFAN